MDDDCLDRIVVSKLAQLVHNFVRVEDHTIEVHYADLVSEGVNSCLLAPRVQCDVHHGEHGQHKEEEGASSDQHPEPDARACVFSHKCPVSLALARNACAINKDFAQTVSVEP